MAQQQRKPVKSMPVTSHPLFPAVAGLWCGAALGLGSLAVRATLLESLVLKSHIDLVIPATAPPLGITARILLALLLAAVGAVIGVVLARRLARPKVVETERKRGAKDFSARPFHVRARDAHPDAPARAPISAHEELGSTGNAPSILTSRRRALAIVHDEDDFVPHDLAPLPGAMQSGGIPQILDIAGIGLAGAQAQAPDALDLGTYAQPAAGAAPASPCPLDWANATPASTPVQPAELPAALAAQRQVFHTDDADPAAAPLPSPASEAAHADGRQVFGMTPQPDRADEPRQIFGIAAVGDHVPQDFVKAAGYQTTVFEGPEPSPLFAPRTAAAEPDAVSPLGPVEPAEEAAPAAELPSPASLGMTDLAARLADAMASRRRRAGAAVAQPEPAPQVAEAAPVPLRVEPAPIPAAFEPAAAPIVADFVVPAAVVPAFTVPDFPVAESDPAPLSLPDPAPEPVAVSPLARLPSAMRPLALDAFLEEDAALDPMQLPPRHIAMPSPVTAAVPAPAPLEAVAAFVSDDEPAEDVVQENYGSLLEITPARAPFVRIDDPAAAEQAHEPVVIFPGQASRPAVPAAASGAADPAEADGSFRRFDAPSSAGQGQPLAAANNGLSAVDPAEAERALRAALSNLQRMSGAA